MPRKPQKAETPLVSYKILHEYEDDIRPEDTFGYETQEENDEAVRAVYELAERTSWGWCRVTVEASVTIDGETFTGRAFLGGCSYESEEEFRREGGYFNDLCREALYDLKYQIAAEMKRSEVAIRAYDAIEKV